MMLGTKLIFIAAAFAVLCAAADATVSIASLEGAPSSADPSSCTQTAIAQAVSFNASSTLGASAIDLSKTHANFTKGSVAHQAATCVNTTSMEGVDWTIINCTGAAFDYYDSSGSWTIAIHVEDSGSSDENSTQNLNYGVGTLMDVQYTSGSAIAFGNVAKGSAGNRDTDGLKLRNCGNVALGNNVTGAAITNGGSNSMAVGQFYVDDDGNYGEDSGNNVILPLTTGAQAFSPYGGAGIPISTGSDSVWALFFFVNVPAGQAAVTYSQGTWAFTPSQA